MYHRRRSRSRHQTSVSLFSFIDVMGGMIGALCLIIIAVSLSQVVPESSSASPLAPPIHFLEAAIQQKTTQISRLREAVAAEKQQEDGLRLGQAQMLELNRQLDRRANRQAFLAQIQPETRSLQSRLTQLTARRDELRRESSRLKTRIHEEGGTVIRDRIEVHFAGRGLNLKPVFVECTYDGLIIRDEGRREQIHWRSIANSDKLHRLMDRVKATAGGSLIFLIRPDGIHAFNLATAEASKRQVRRGKLPIPGQGELDLGQFEETGGDRPEQSPAGQDV